MYAWDEAGEEKFMETHVRHYFGHIREHACLLLNLSKSQTRQTGTGTRGSSQRSGT